MGLVAKKVLPYVGSPTLHSGEANEQWAKSGRGSYISPAIWRGPQRFRAWNKIRNGQRMGLGRQMVLVVTSPVPSQGFPTL